jgi:flagellar motor switch protein FliM
MGEKFGRDSIWENHLASELWQTDVQLSAVLDSAVVSLRDVLNWQVGSRLMLTTPPDGLVDLHCGDVQMFQGRMGRRKGNIAVRIDRDAPKQEEHGR